MASYFDEHDCESNDQGSSRQINAEDSLPDLLNLVRSLIAGDDFPLWISEIASMNGTGSGLAPPASKKAVDELVRRSIRKDEFEDELKCPVCLVQFDEDDSMIELPCNHVFHGQCILPWLEKTNSCPNCRHELPTDDPTYERFKKEKEEETAREERAQEYLNSMFG